MFMWDLTIGQVVKGIQQHGLIYGALIGTTAFTIMYLPKYLYEWTNWEIVNRIWGIWASIWASPIIPLWLVSAIIANWCLAKFLTFDNGSKKLAGKIQDLMDRNKDGVITPKEVGQFLQNFSPRSIRKSLRRDKRRDKEEVKDGPRNIETHNPARRPNETTRQTTNRH